VSVTIPIERFRLKAGTSRRAVVPGAEEFAPSVTGVWLPPERTFSSLSSDGRFRTEQTQHTQVSVERDLGPGVTLSIRGFNQKVTDQLVEIFTDELAGQHPGRGHYFVGVAGDVDARGAGVGLTSVVARYLRGSIEYTMATASWHSLEETMMAQGKNMSLASSPQRVYDVQATVEATIPRSLTRIYARYRTSTAFSGPEVQQVVETNAVARFNVRVNQSLKFFPFSSADWEMLVDVRNLFRDSDDEASLYDEALALKAPKRIVGGLLVRF
jgi:hypothetical protein